MNEIKRVRNIPIIIYYYKKIVFFMRNIFNYSVKIKEFIQANNYVFFTKKFI